MNTQIQTVNFHGQSLSVFQHNGKFYVAMKPICENIGLDWEAQRQKIKRNHVLNSVAFMTQVAAQDGKKYETLCLPLGYVNGWLMNVEVNRVKPEIRETLIRYQMECYDVLFQHFMPQKNSSENAMPQSKKALPNGLTIEQQDEVKKLHRELVQAAPKEMQAKLAIMLWSSIKSKFGVSYKEVPSEHYAEVLSVMARVAVEQQNTTLHGEVLDKAPTPNAPTSQEYFAHLAKMAHYAGEYEKIQSMLCNNPNSDETKKFMTAMNWRSSQSGAAYLFVFKPDIHNDVKKAFDFLHYFSQAV